MPANFLFIKSQNVFTFDLNSYRMLLKRFGLVVVAITHMFFLVCLTHVLQVDCS